MSQNLSNINKIYVPFSAEEVNNLIKPDAKRLILFSCIREHSANVEANTFVYVSQLCKECDQLFFLTNDNRKVTSLDASKFDSKVTIIHVENYLWDIGMYFRILCNLDILKFDRIALINDSCTILKPLEAVFEIAREQKYGFWGISESHEIKKHIQSYFLVVENTNGIMDLFSKFVYGLKQEILNMPNLKQQIILQVEIGLSQYFLNAQKPIDAIYKFDDVTSFQTSISERPAYMNPSYNFWDRMLEKGCPLLKKTRSHFANERLFIDKFKEFPSSDFKRTKIL